MEAMRHPPLPRPAEATASTNTEPPVDDVAIPSEATPPPPVQKNWSVDATLPTEKDEMQSTKKNASIHEPSCTPVIGDPSIYDRRNILLLGRDLGVPALYGPALLVALASVLYALLTPWLLWRAAGQPMTFVWATSLFVVSYSLIGTICLSETMGPTGALLRFSGGTLLAAAASHLIGSVTGAAAPSLVTFYATGTLGYSVGEYLQRVGFEKSADVVAGRPARDEEKEKIRDEWFSFLCFMQGIISAFILARVAWVVFVPGSTAFDDPADEPLAVVQEISAEMILLAWIWSGIVALPLLEEALVTFDTLFGKGLACFVATYVLSIAFMAAKRYAASLLVMWTVAMAVVGFFGYCLAVYDRCKHIRSRNQPISE